MTKQEILDFDLNNLNNNYGVKNIISDINLLSNDDDKEEVILHLIDNYISRSFGVAVPSTPFNNAKLIISSFSSVIQRYKYNRGKPHREQREREEREEKIFNRELNIALLTPYSKEEILNLDLNKTITDRIESKVLILSIEEMSEEDTIYIVEKIIDSFFPPEYLKTIDHNILRQTHIKECRDVIEVHRMKVDKLNGILNFLNNNDVIDIDELLTEIYQKHKEYFIFINRIFNNRIAHINGTVTDIFPHINIKK